MGPVPWGSQSNIWNQSHRCLTAPPGTGPIGIFAQDFTISFKTCFEGKCSTNLFQIKLQFELSFVKMQGTVPASIKCAVQIDTLGRYCYTYNTGCYLYRNAFNIPPLGMIDDIAAISECGDESIVLNSIINAKIETKKLQFDLKKSLNKINLL